jgi:hypothetical protein
MAKDSSLTTGEKIGLGLGLAAAAAITYGVTKSSSNGSPNQVGWKPTKLSYSREQSQDRQG